MGNPLEGTRLELGHARRLYVESQPKQAKRPDPTVQRDLRAGWLLHYLAPLDGLLWGRWAYWADLQAGCDLPAAPIPRLEFENSPQDAAHGRKMLTRCLNAVAGENLSGDGWMGWSSFRNFDYLLDWLLFGFGHPGYEALPKEETAGASMRLYQLFDLAPLLLWPYDHFGDMLAECSHGRGNGFFPTPQCVVEMMVRMTMGEGDHRAETVCDPALGSGRMLLHASNHSLRLYGQDIDATMCKTSLVNGYLFAPWLSRPIWWLDGATLRLGNTLRQECGAPVNQPAGGEAEAIAARAALIVEALKPLVESAVEIEEAEEETPRVAAVEELARLSDEMTAVAPPHYQAQLFDTEFDATGTAKTAPILKRRKRTAPSDETAPAPAQLNLLEV